MRVSDGKLECHARDALENLVVLNTDGSTRVIALASQSTGVPQLLVGQARLAGDELAFRWQLVKTWKPMLPPSVRSRNGIHSASALAIR